MKAKLFILLMVIVVCVNLFSGKTWACSGNYGDVIGYVKGVEIFSNGALYDCTRTTEGNLEYQCVALIKRFYKEAMGVNLYHVIGVAENYYENFQETGYEYDDTGTSQGAARKEHLCSKGDEYREEEIMAVAYGRPGKEAVYRGPPGLSPERHGPHG